MTQSEEDYYFNAFKDLYCKLPIGEYIRCEQPDYIIKTADKVIGVEITQVFTDNYIDKNNNKKRTEVLRRMLGQRLCERMAKIVPYNFVLSIDFSSKIFSQSEIDKIVRNCIRYLTGIPFVKNHRPIDVFNFGDLPNEIDKMNIFYYPSLKKPFFSETDSGILPDLSPQHLQVVLDKKHKALKKYRQCDEHWLLLIVLETYLSDSFGDISIPQFETEFQRVFLYRYAKKKIVELK